MLVAENCAVNWLDCAAAVDVADMFPDMYDMHQHELLTDMHKVTSRDHSTFVSKERCGSVVISPSAWHVLVQGSILGPGMFDVKTCLSTLRGRTGHEEDEFIYLVTHIKYTILVIKQK